MDDTKPQNPAQDPATSGGAPADTGSGMPDEPVDTPVVETPTPVPADETPAAPEPGATETPAPEAPAVTPEQPSNPGGGS